MADQPYPLMKVNEADMDRNARAVRAVCEWGRQVQQYVTVDDASAIVSAVITEWRADNIHEAVRDEQIARECVQRFVETAA